MLSSLFFPITKKRFSNIEATVYIPNDAYTFNENDATTNIPIILQGNLAIPVTVR
jgi:hypothetical protein